ncbi:RNA polymerase sigma-70 factor, sigma-E family [Jatrophihabitans endophyticus]|uniref:RNA polymerase sigma-70 factor, sigma-E family n=1 Tax=Jatrophihabitans endophyticus TaxID=1206085 RepID=A0A1M5IQ88_9ACTN|nr:SigE family RNA polymerase sigma factor [Jatrophihabitans endophyticus]SHG30386.1 RNA polymerase sigma-70 factor, sigma-E family [Jatrophihabitans endophyticus]
MGSAADFDAYVQQHGDALLRFAVTLTGDPRLAEEIVQDVLLRAFQRWERITVLERPHAYVRRMVVNEHVSWRRRWSRLEPRAEVEPAVAVSDDGASRDDRAELVAEIVRLPRRQRAVLAMRYFEDLPDDEIAAALGCSRATVRSIAARALAALRVRMTEADPSDPHPSRDPAPRAKEATR